MKRSALALLMGLLLAIACPSALRAKEPLKYFLKPIAAWSIISDNIFSLADIDGDGHDELFIPRGYAVTGLKQRGNEFVPFDEWTFREAGRMLGFCDATGDGRPEFFVHSVRKEGQSIASYSVGAPAGGSFNFSMGPYLPERPRDQAKEEGTLNFMGCFDIDRNGKPEIYIGISPFYSEPLPRSLRVYDGATGDSLWNFDLGPQTQMCMAMDSKIGPVLIMTTFACDNGAIWNGSGDTLSSVYCFDAKGDTVWTTPVTGRLGWTVMDTITCAAYGGRKILLGRYLGESENAQSTWNIALLHPDDGTFIRRDTLGTSIGSIRALDLDGDSRSEILIVGTDGRFRILNNDFSIKASTQDRFHKQGLNSIVAVTDLNGDGSREIVLMGANGILIRDSEGKLLAEEDLVNEYQLAVAAVGEAKRIVAQSNGMVAFYALERMPLRFTVGQIAAIVIGCVGFGAGAGFSGIALRRWLKWRRIAMAYLEEARYDLLMAMTAFGHGGSSTLIMDRLQFRLVNWEEMHRSAPNGEGGFDELSSAFRDTVAPDLRQIVFLSRKAKIPREHWRDMVSHSERARKALSALLDARGRASSVEGGAFAAEASASIAAIDKGLAAIRAELRDIFRAEILPSLGRVVSRREEELSALGCSPKIRVADAAQTSVFISPGAFEKILDGLVSNAMEAMKRVDCPELEIAVASEGARCTIDVRDNGSGIAESDQERVFDMGYTTKAAGGFGLYYSRDEIAKYGGEIYVLESAPGKGSTFRMVLKHA